VRSGRRPRRSSQTYTIKILNHAQTYFYTIQRSVTATGAAGSTDPTSCA
jgi:hypothetical protein